MIACGGASGKTMSEGFVYILVNPSLEGLVKIGLTSQSPEGRASSLSAHTAVPPSFKGVYDELVAHCVEVEKRLHKRFEAYRVSERREFFRVPSRKLLRLSKLKLGFSLLIVRPRCDSPLSDD